jgi:hypothetical protein
MGTCSLYLQGRRLKQTGNQRETDSKRNSIWRYILEDRTLHNHSWENFNIFVSCSPAIIRIQYKVDPRTSKDLMFEQLEARLKNLWKIRFWNSNKNSKVKQRITWSSRLVEKWRPTVAVVNRSINLFNDNVMQYFRNIFKNGKKTNDIRQVSLQRKNKFW